MKLILDYTKTLDQNAGAYYEKAKKARKKREGALEALKKSEKQLAKLQKEKENLDKAFEEKLEKEKEKREKKRPWYDHFHWFISSEGFLVIGGRDATSNEIIVKKHASKGDIVFHTEIAGSPFFVVKADRREVGDISKEEAAIATASYSRAWRQGLAVMDVFYVSPEQISKTAQSGEFIQRGSFIARGKKSILTVSLGIAIGIYKDSVMAGPLSGVRKHCDKYVEVCIGSEKAGQAAKLIKKRIGGDLDEIIRGLPSGGVRVKYII